MLLKILFLAAFLYFLWTKILRLYYMYWFYTRQGFRCTSFPLPVVGNALVMARSMKGRTEYSETLMTEYLTQSFGKAIPYYVVDLTAGSGFLILSDPELV